MQREAGKLGYLKIYYLHHSSEFPSINQKFSELRFWLCNSSQYFRSANTPWQVGAISV